MVMCGKTSQRRTRKTDIRSPRESTEDEDRTRTQNKLSNKTKLVY
jgi:hypothetical protein